MVGDTVGQNQTLADLSSNDVRASQLLVRNDLPKAVKVSGKMDEFLLRNDLITPTNRSGDLRGNQEMVRSWCHSTSFNTTK
jgi:hypothetical protein